MHRHTVAQCLFAWAINNTPANICISNHFDLPAPVADAVGNIVETVVNTVSNTVGDTAEDTVGTKDTYRLDHINFSYQQSHFVSFTKMRQQ